MKKKDVLNYFRLSGALIEGHFKLSSGLHSEAYLQCARVLMNPKHAEKLCKSLADQIRARVSKPIQLVVSPAMGGVVVGYEMARQLGVQGIFTERVDGELQLRRGFEIPEGTRVLMAEDIVTTGLSSRECIECVEKLGGRVVMASCLVDRSNGKAEIGTELCSLLAMDIKTYEPNDLPEHLKNIPAIKPGSRGLK
ncbi:MAG: orotate phosphoribosyltransferase [Sphingomonadales bacterium]